MSLSSIVRPVRLATGSRIGLVSMSSAVASFVPRRVARAVSALESMGYDVIPGETVTLRTGYTAGSPQQRADEFMRMVKDPSIDAIVSTIGGLSSNQVLGLLDYEAIREHPKIFIGYSDITAILSAIVTRAGVVAFHGPAALPSLGDFGGADTFTTGCFRQVLESSQPPGVLPASTAWTDEVLRWDSEDGRARVTEPNRGPWVINSGRATGRLTGGNTSTMLVLAGTPYWPVRRGDILLVEFEDGCSADQADRRLTQLHQMGTLDEVAAIAIGRSPNNVFGDHHNGVPESLRAIFARLAPDVPVAYGFDFGHTEPQLTIPLGVAGTLDCTGSAPVLTVDDAAVSEPLGA